MAEYNFGDATKQGIVPVTSQGLGAFGNNNFGNNYQLPTINTPDPSLWQSFKDFGKTNTAPNLSTIKDPGMFQQGGALSTGMGALGTVGQLYLGAKQAKLSGDQFNWQKNAFDREYDSKRTLVNDEMFGREVLRNREQGMSQDEATLAADKYVADRGVKV